MTGEIIPSLASSRQESEIPAVAQREETAPGVLFDCRTARAGFLDPDLELQRHAVPPPVAQADRGRGALQRRAVVVVLFVPEDRAVQQPALPERRAAGQTGGVTVVAEGGDPAYRNDSHIARREQADPDDLAGVGIDVPGPRGARNVVGSVGVGNA